MAKVLLSKSDSSNLYLNEAADGFELNGYNVVMPSKDGTVALAADCISSVGQGLELSNNKVSAKIKGGEKVISASDEGFSSTLSLAWDPKTKRVALKGVDGEVISDFDATDFVKDGMLNSVELSADGGKEYIVFTWNTDGGKTTLPLDVTKFVDTYTNGDGLDLVDHQFSVDYAEVSAGVHLSAFETSAHAASTYLTKTDAGSTYATITELTGNYLKTSVASETYLTKTSAASTYETTANVSSFKTEVASTYATKTALEAVTKALSTETSKWSEVTLEKVYALVKAMATAMGANFQ